MRIILTQDEIEEAIENLILEQVNVPEDMRIDIDLKATRGEEGYQAFIDIVDLNAPKGDRSIDARIKPTEGSETLGIAKKVEEAKAKAEEPRRRGRPAGSKNKPKDDGSELVSEPVKTTDKVTEAPKTEELPQEAPLAQEVEAVAEKPTETTKTDEVEPVKEDPVDYQTALKASEADAPKPTEVTEEPVPAAPTKSLFANLAKPVNTPTES